MSVPLMYVDGEPVSAAEIRAALVAAREVLATKAWGQGALAHDCFGMSVSPLSSAACSFCSVGALDRATHREPFTTGSPVWTAALSHLSRVTMAGVPSWNDAPGRTRDEVLAAFDRAIALVDEDAKERSA